MPAAGPGRSRLSADRSGPRHRRCRRCRGLGDYFVGERTRVYISTGQRVALVVPELRLSPLRRGYVRLKDGTEVVVQPGMPAEAASKCSPGCMPGDVVAKP